MLTGPGNQGRVAEWVDFYTFVEDVSVEDVTGATAMLGVIGPGAPSVVEAATGVAAPELAPYELRVGTVGGAEALVVRTDPIGEPGYDVVVAADDRGEALDALLSADATPAPVEVGGEALDALRIEHGVPAFGRELTEAFNPLEAGLIDIISFTKGCYVGQEVVARLNTYDKVQKRLMRMRWGDGAGPEPGAKLVLEGKQVGVVTSAAISPAGGGVGIGYVRLAHASAGVVLAGEGGGFSVELVGPSIHPAERRGTRDERRWNRLNAGALGVTGGGAGYPLRVAPPSTTSTCPRIIAASFVHRNATMFRDVPAGHHSTEERLPSGAPHLFPFGKVVERLRVDESTGHGVHRYALRRELHRKIAGHGLERGLGGSHREVVRQHPLRPEAGQVDYAAAPGHQPGRLDGAEPRRAGVDVHRPVPVLHLELLDRPLDARSRIVDQDVEPRVRGRHVGEQASYLLGVAEVGSDAQAPDPERLDLALRVRRALVVAQVVEGDVRPAAGELQRDGAADPPGGAGN